MNISKRKIYTSKIISFLSTPLAVNFTYKVFTAPIKSEKSEQELFFNKSLHTEDIWIKSINKKIGYYTYGYSQKSILLLHSWSGRSTEYHKIANKLLEHGYMVIAFKDEINQKLIAKEISLNLLFEAICTLNDKFQFTAAIGHGIGGLMLYKNTERLQLKKLITIGCPNTITELVRKFNRKIGLKKEIAELIINKIEHEFKVDLTDIEASKNAQKINIPTLIIHDKKDNYISIQNAHDIKINLRKHAYIYTKNLNQRKILNNEYITNQIINFIDNEGI